MYESSGSQFFRSTTEIQSEPDHNPTAHPPPMAVMGGWEIFTGNGGKPGIFWFYNVGDDKVSLHNQQRGANSPILWRLPYIVTPHPFSSFVPPPPTPLSPLTSTPTVLSVVLFLWLNVWSHHIWCAILHNENMDLHTSSLVTLVPEGTWRVFYATRCKVYWALTHNVVFYWYSDLISHTQTHKYTQHTQGLVEL